MVDKIRFHPKYARLGLDESLRAFDEFSFVQDESMLGPEAKAPQAVMAPSKKLILNKAAEREEVYQMVTDISKLADLKDFMQ